MVRLSIATNEGATTGNRKIYPGGLTGRAGRWAYPRSVDLEAWIERERCPWCDHEGADILEHAEAEHPQRTEQAFTG